MKSAQKIAAAERMIRRRVIANPLSSVVDVRVAYAVEQALKWARGQRDIGNMCDYVLEQSDRVWQDLRRVKY